jgi:hypothetical protein
MPRLYALNNRKANSINISTLKGFGLHPVRGEIFVAKCSEKNNSEPR